MRLAIRLVSLLAIVAAQIQECYFKGPQEWCKLANGTEFPLECHVIGSQTWCQDYDNTSEFLRGQSTFSVNSTASAAATSSTNATQATTSTAEEKANCHFHAGVEHCVGGAKSSRSCAGTKRDYNIPLRIGALLIVLVTSALAIFSPVLLTRFTRLSTSGVIFIIVKNFGAGVVISTALIHLMTHANLLFASECLGHLQYEGVVAAFVMAGIFLSFLIEYAGWRLVANRHQKQSVSESSSTTKSAPSSGKAADEETAVAVMEKDDGTLFFVANRRKLDAISVLVMECGILFHSIFIGITCVVTPDSGFGQIFAVIIFHQMFEGLALAARVADADISFRVKMICCSGFMLITPLGMGIGIGVLNQFNGNDPTTIWTIGIFDSVSAGILVWVGLVELLASSWLWGDMRHASGLRVLSGLGALVAGLVIMSVLGKWA